MNRNRLSIVIFLALVFISFKNSSEKSPYLSNYLEKLDLFRNRQQVLMDMIRNSDVSSPADLIKIKEQIDLTRNDLKTMDFWFRYLEPLSYKKINGPLPVEWETEVFEKFEKPYKREGAGLTLAGLYLEEEHIDKEELVLLIQSSIDATAVYGADSITNELKTYHSFYLCNRLFLLNLAAIYTTGFECPDTSRVIPELRFMLSKVNDIYRSFNTTFPNESLSEEYMTVYENLMTFANEQPDAYTGFDHFTFIKDFIGPLYSLNQKLIRQYKVVTKSYVDYSLSKNNNLLFSKTLYNGQNSKGIFLRVQDPADLAELDRIGKLLFYDPILSGNNQRSCASCHISGNFFTDTQSVTSFQFDHKSFLDRNTPSLINVGYNHLVMLDGKHISLQDQTKAVITNPIELGANEKEVLEKVLSCTDYKRAFTRLLKYTPQQPEISFDHIVSAITFYYGKFSNYYAPFDMAMNENQQVNADVKEGFNLFMSKAQCATCHFVPQFNGVKPPFVSSEFEVIGVPSDTAYSRLSPDKGRYMVNPADETLNAFRTGTVRNAAATAPYMHNGVFSNLNQVIDFYDHGGGVGRSLAVANQTLSSDSLHLTNEEKEHLIVFIQSLTENIPFEDPPARLPVSKDKKLNARRVGGIY